MSAAAAPVAVTRNDCAQGAMLTVDLAAVAANTRFFASRTKAEVMAVVKADGFGHGCVPAARTALENGATWLGVTSIAEGLALREAGLAAPVLSWLNPVDADFGYAMSMATWPSGLGIGGETKAMSGSVRTLSAIEPSEAATLASPSPFGAATSRSLDGGSRYRAIDRSTPRSPRSASVRGRRAMGWAIRGCPRPGCWRRPSPRYGPDRP